MVKSQTSKKTCLSIRHNLIHIIEHIFLYNTDKSSGNRINSDEVERLGGREEKRKTSAALDTESKEEERKVETLKPEEQDVDDPSGVDDD
jgi:hypothetical protein